MTRILFSLGGERYFILDLAFLYVAVMVVDIAVLLPPPEMSHHVGGAQPYVAADYLHICRDFLFLTSYKSQRYCQELEKLTESQAQTRDLEERQYQELKDDEMDLWLKLTPSTSTESKDFLEKGYKVTYFEIRSKSFLLKVTIDFPEV